MNINALYDNVNRFLLFIALALFVACLTLIATTGKEPDTEKDQYCEMVKIGIESGGEFGWKDFKHNYKERCL
tara:strand:- start:20967 stop:21182 length:216 start_codon:yes stop_codon:yes gene_type:complete